MADTDVVIVHYSTPDLLRRCLEALTGMASAALGQVVVVDNASPGRDVEEMRGVFPGVAFQLNDRNLGFAAACNQGICRTASPYCLLLNPDAVLDGEALGALERCLAELPEAGAAAPRLINSDGSLQWSCRRFPTLRAVLVRGARLEELWPGPVDAYLMRDWDHGHRAPVDWALGACLLLRRVAVEQVGLLDEDYFLYYEDTDLCRRLGLAGWPVYYEPAAVVQHEHRRESAGLVPGRPARAHLRSLVRLFRKHRFPIW